MRLDTSEKDLTVASRGDGSPLTSPADPPVRGRVPEETVSSNVSVAPGYLGNRDRRRDASGERVSECLHVAAHHPSGSPE